MIDVVVVGLGRIGVGFQRDPRRIGVTTHTEAWRRHPMTRLVGGVDPEDASRAAFERDTGLPAYPSWDECRKRHRPAVVSVCVPPDLHAETVCQALGDGAQRILCEKPCTATAEAARQLLQELGRDACRVGVNFHRRFDPLHRRLFGLLQSDELRSGSGVYTAGLLNTASHWIEGLLHAGGRVDRLLALPVIDGTDPTPTVLLHLTNGGTVSLHAGAVSDYMLFDYDLLGRRNRVQLREAGSSGFWSRAAASPRFSEYNELQPARAALPLGLSNALLPVVDDAVCSLLEDRPMLCTVEDAVRVHTVLEAVRSSLGRGTWVEVEG